MDEELFTRDSPKKSTRRRVEPENTTKEKSMGDKLKNETSAADSYRKKLMNDFSFMSFAPIIFISAKTGQRLDRLFELIKYVHEQNSMRISTGMLNDMLAYATAKVQPPSDKGKRLKIYYMTQTGVTPPTFVLFCNDSDYGAFITAINESGESRYCNFGHDDFYHSGSYCSGKIWFIRYRTASERCHCR